MIQTTINGLIMVLLARWVINDLPHAAGLLRGSDWVEQSWQELLTFADSKGVSLRQAYEESSRVLPERTLRSVRTVFGGYYLIATGRASDEVVDKVFTFMKDKLQRMIDEITMGENLDTFMEELRREDTIESRAFLKSIEGVLLLRPAFDKAITRIDKVAAIDSAIHYMHERGQFIMMFFYLSEGPLHYALEATIEQLAR